MSGKRTSSAERPPAAARLPGPKPFEAPDPAAFAFPDPFNSRSLLAYYDQLRLAHGYIRFVSLPHLDDRPDVPIERLYVPARLAPRHIRSQEDPKTWGELEEVLDALAENPHLVVLGDPGSGKSTLVSWVAWQLSAARSGPYPRRLGPLVPLPFVLRDLPLDRHLTWDALLGLFARQEFQRVAEEGKGRLSSAEIQALLATGQAFVLIDGLDEIGSIEVRRALRAAIREGRTRHPGCRFLVTSRIVGYDEVDLNGEPSQEEYHQAFEEAMARQDPALPRRASRGKVSVGATNEPDPFVIRYAAPFDDTQIERFARAWYSRFASESGAAGEQRAQDLVEAIRAHAATLALARVPILLTFIALIHRIEARLPHGRARLYGKIADAYLESIDTYRRVRHEGGAFYALEEKRRWLAFVAYRLQLRRAKAPSVKKGREILVEETELVGWLAEAMASSPTAAPEEGARRAEARAFLDYLARRSGLLLPRGQGSYAFAHLSIQEYFAAEHLRLVRRSRNWIKNSSTKNLDGPDDLREHAGQPLWTEVFFLLFELYAGDPEGAGDLAEDLFGEGYERIGKEADEVTENLAHLLAQVGVDRHGGLPAAARRSAWRSCWSYALAASLGWVPFNRRPIGKTLAEAEEDDLPEVAAELKSAFAENPSGSLALRGVSPSRIPRLLEAVPGLRALDLAESPISALEPLQGLSALQYLNLSGTQVSELEPLRGLSALQSLYLSGTQVSDLEPMRGMRSLKILYLERTQVSDLEPLRGLSALEFMDLDGTQVRDLEPLRGLSALKTLYLSGTQESDVEPLRALPQLEFVFGLTSEQERILGFSGGTRQKPR